MSLFKSTKKYQKESEESVKVCEKLNKHEASYPEIKKKYDVAGPEVVRLQSEVNDILQSEGKSEAWKKKDAEFKKTVRKREEPLHTYRVVKGDLQRELETLTRPVISEEGERWEDETSKIKDQEVYQEIPADKSPPGEFSVGGSHKVLTNRKAIRLFREKSLENLLHLRGMIHNSIPEIQTFIQKAEVEMQTIDLTPQIIEMDAKIFQGNLRDFAKEPGKIETGFVPPLGEPFIVNPQAGQGKDEGDDLFRKFDSFKAKL